MQDSSYRSIISSFVNEFHASPPDSGRRNKSIDVIRGIVNAWINDITAGRLAYNSTYLETINTWLDEVDPVPALERAPLLPLPVANVPEPVNVGVAVKEKKPKKAEPDAEKLIAAFEQMYRTGGNMIAFVENEEVEAFLTAASDEANILYQWRLENGIILLDNAMVSAFPLHIRRISVVLRKLMHAQDDKPFRCLAEKVPGIVDLYAHSFVSVCLKSKNEELLEYIFSMLAKQCNLRAPKIRDLYGTLTDEWHNFARDHNGDLFLSNIEAFWAKIDPVQLSGKKRKIISTELSDDDDDESSADDSENARPVRAINSDVACKKQAPTVKQWIRENYKITTSGAWMKQKDLCDECFHAGKITKSDKSSRVGTYALQSIAGAKREKRGKQAWINIEPK